MTADQGLLQLEEGEIDVLFDGNTLTWEGSPDGTLDRYIRETVQQAAFGDRAESLGLGSGDIATLFEAVELDEVRLDGGDEEFGIRLAAAAVSAFANFLLLQIWGSFLNDGRDRGKDLEGRRGTCFPTFDPRPCSVAGAWPWHPGSRSDADPDRRDRYRPVPGPGDQCATRGMDRGSAVARHVPPGFGFYATAFAAVGAMVSRQEDAQTAQLPVVMPLLAGYFIASSGIGNPGNIAVTVASFVPFTSPVVLPFRTAMTDVPWWQVALSLAILAASIVVMLRLAGRIYRYSLLRTGARVSLSEAWQNRNQESLSG